MTDNDKLNMQDEIDQTEVSKEKKLNDDTNVA